MSAAFQQKYQISKELQQIIKRSRPRRSDVNNHIERAMHCYEAYCCAKLYINYLKVNGYIIIALGLWTLSQSRSRNEMEISIQFQFQLLIHTHYYRVCQKQ